MNIKMIKKLRVITLIKKNHHKYPQINIQTVVYYKFHHDKDY